MLHKTLSFSRLVVSLFIHGIILFGSFLTGDTRVPPPPHPQGLNEFVHSCHNPTFEQKFLFVQAYNAQLGGNNAYARQLYQNLLKEFPDNTVINYNLSLLS